MNESFQMPPPGDFRLALLWAGVTLGLAIIKKLPFGKKNNNTDMEKENG